MFLYDLPFIPTQTYVDFLNTTDNVYSVYFSSHIPTFDARIINPGNLVILQNNLAKLTPSVKKYMTLNGRFSPLKFYTDPKFTKGIFDTINSYVDKELLTGLIILDPYMFSATLLLQQIDISKLDIILSINCNIDTIAKLETNLQLMRKLIPEYYPSKIILDRSLNRDIKKLKELSKYIRKYYPLSKIEALVNEGCLLNCPFKINHDIIISMINNGNQDPALQGLNSELGCAKYFMSDNSSIIKSPFVRPEDIKYLKEYVDVLKISGKLFTDKIVMNTYTAYNKEEYCGNLLNLMDTIGYFSDKLFVINDWFPVDFFEKVTNCTHNCDTCMYCTEIYTKVVQSLKKEK